VKVQKFQQKLCPEKQENGMEVSYTGTTDGYWGTVYSLPDGDWSKWLKISFDIKSVDGSANEIRFMNC